MSVDDDFWNEPLSPEEFETRLAKAHTELEGPEGEAMREYRDWFMRKYPDPLDRLAYIRRKMSEVLRRPANGS